MGWRKNFLTGLRYTTGDIIFFSDQDDVLEVDKLQSMTESMAGNEKILALSGCIRLIGNEGQWLPNNKNLPFYGGGTGKLRPAKYNAKFLYSWVLGCTLAIRRELLQYLQYLSESDMNSIAHDELFWKLALLQEGAYFLDKDVIRYRAHDKNTSTASQEASFGALDIDTRVKSFDAHRIINRKLLEIIPLMEIEGKDYKAHIIQKSLQFIENRIDLFRHKRIKNIFTLLANGKHYLSYRMFFGDVAYLLNVNRLAGKLYKRLKDS